MMVTTTDWPHYGHDTVRNLSYFTVAMQRRLRLLSFPLAEKNRRAATRAKQDLKGDAHSTTRIHQIHHLNADSRGIRQYSREGR
jgi:hypothetical protein